MNQFKCLFFSMLVAALCTSSVTAQKFFTKDGKVSFSATSPNSPEKIEGATNKAIFAVDVATGAVEMKLLMKGFHFERALMEEHFNENYVQSTQFPKADFQGTVTDIKSVNLAKDGVYPIHIEGSLSMHGQTNKIKTTGTLTVSNGIISAAKSSIAVNLTDYKIDIPSIVRDKVAQQAKIEVNLTLAKMVSKQ